MTTENIVTIDIPADRDDLLATLAEEVPTWLLRDASNWERNMTWAEGASTPDDSVSFSGESKYHSDDLQEALQGWSKAHPEFTVTWEETWEGGDGGGSRTTTFKGGEITSEIERTAVHVTDGTGLHLNRLAVELAEWKEGHSVDFNIVMADLDAVLRGFRGEAL